MSKIDQNRNLLLILGAIVFGLLISSGVRLQEFPRWNHPEMMVDNQFILATPDAYAWVAGVSRPDTPASSSPMAILLRWIASLFRSSPAGTAFWAPVLLASLVTIPLVLWSTLMRAPGAAVLCGTLGALAPAYFTRTRLGYYDTDWAALTFPLIFAFLLAAWIRPHIGPWNRAPSEPKRPRNSVVLPIIAILVIQLGMPWHSSIKPFFLVSLLLSAGLSLFLMQRSQRSDMIWVLLGMAVAVLWGWLGGLLGILLILAMHRRKRITPHPERAKVAVGLLILLISGLVLAEAGSYLVEKIPDYWISRPLPATGELRGAEFSYPSLAPSIGELQSPDPMSALSGMAYSGWIGILGIASFGYVMWRQPAAILLAPLVVLGLASVQLGARFAMFGGSIILVSIIVCSEWLLQSLWKKKHKLAQVVFTISLGISLLAGIIISNSYRELTIDTVVSREHAEALIELDAIAGGEGLVWTWWDYGYATQYFAGLSTFADGGRNTGVFLYTLGTVMSAEDPDVSRDLVMLAAANDYQPWMAWEKWGMGEYLQRVRDGNLTDPDQDVVETQFIAVQWDTLPSLPWIRYYGTWDFENAEGELGFAEYILSNSEFDLERGEFRFSGEPMVKLTSIDVLGLEAVDHYTFENNPNGLHLLINSETQEVLLLDRHSYYSTVVQLLIGSPEVLASSTPFQLVIQRDPFIRIFRVH